MIPCRLFAATLVLALALFGWPAIAEIRIGTAGPMTGATAWFGEQYVSGAGLAVDDLNAAGGVLGQQVKLIVADDFCDPDQAVVTAQKLVDDGVVFVAGHFCSHSSIAASKVYEKAAVLQIAPGSAAAVLTDDGGANVFRVCGRDDQQGAMVADHLAKIWADRRIGILDDGTAWGRGVAEAARRRLDERRIPVAFNTTFTPGEPDYSALVTKMQEVGVDIVFIGGLHPETALIFRQAHDRGYPVELIASSASATEDFPMIAGPAVEGTLMAGMTDVRENPKAVDVVARFRARGYEPLGYTLYAYAAVQVWGQAVNTVGTLNLEQVAQTLHGRQFETVLGTIGFDAEGDVTGVESWQWYVWHADGNYAPLEPSSSDK